LSCYGGSFDSLKEDGRLRPLNNTREAFQSS